MDIHICDGPFPDEQLRLWREQIVLEYPNHNKRTGRDGDDATGSGLLVSLLETTKGFDCVCAALKEDSLVGMLHYCVVRKVFSIFTLAVADNYQKQGYGTRLLEHLQAKAKARKCRIDTASAILDPAIGCLLKAGFRYVGKPADRKFEWGHRRQRGSR